MRTFVFACVVLCAQALRTSSNKKQTLKVQDKGIKSSFDDTQRFVEAQEMRRSDLTRVFETTRDTSAVQHHLQYEWHMDAVPVMSVRQIFYLCVAMYGVTGILWAIAYASNSLSPGSDIHTVLICLTFSAMALGMNILNKTLVTSLAAPCLITAIQMLSTVGTLVILNYPKLQEIQGKHKVWLIVPVLFAGMLISSLCTYQYMTLSMFTVVRNLAPVICLPIESVMMPAGKGPTVTSQMIASLVIMFLGALIYSLDKLAFTVLGLVCATLNMTLGISDRLVQRRLLTEECQDLPTEACAFLNNFVGIIPALLAASLMGEMSNLQIKAAEWTDPQVLFLLILSCAIGLGIAYFGLATQRAVSATSVMVIQNLQRLFVVGVGIIYFGDGIWTWHAQTGIAVSIFGSLWYSKIQVDLRAQPPKNEEGEAK